MSISVRKLKEGKKLRKKQLDLSLQKIVSRLKKIGAEKIIAFGSFVSGNVRRWSDLDLLVVMPSTKSGKEWFKEVYERVDPDIAADILPFTAEELARQRETSSFIRHALKTGRVVYEKG